ncbi:MAG: hypothetical protein PHH24_00175 [Candidatus Moranbacteria bacterium]|nr:hypothetical protein [Candidatus Moranbacteria bacterium]MDD5652348.1 hypothetical protein [Candidatus Moranbacteria bacterium]MDX9855647.1 hypothetical protein [Candidatus Moranbacteria bacterium]
MKIKKENSYYINPENLHDPNFDKGKNASIAYERMERLQKILKEINEHMGLKKAFILDLEKSFLSLKDDPSRAGAMEEMEKVIEDGRNELEDLEQKSQILGKMITSYFLAHSTQESILDKSIDENTDTEN